MVTLMPYFKGAGDMNSFNIAVAKICSEFLGNVRVNCVQESGATSAVTGMFQDRRQ